MSVSKVILLPHFLWHGRARVWQNSGSTNLPTGSAGIFVGHSQVRVQSMRCKSRHEYSLLNTWSKHCIILLDHRSRSGTLSTPLISLRLAKARPKHSSPSSTKWSRAVSRTTRCACVHISLHLAKITISMVSVNAYCLIVHIM